MKRFFGLVLAGCLAVAAAAWLLMRQERHDTAGSFDPVIPHHSFFADEPTPPDPLQCDFSMVETGETLYRMWSRPLQDCTIGPGWTHPSDAGIRAFGFRPWIEFFVTDGEPDLLILTAKGLPHPSSGALQSTDIFVNGTLVARRELSDEWSIVAVELHPGTVRRGSNRIEFGFAHRVPSTPGRTGKRDPRRFAADLLDLTLATHSDPDKNENDHRKLVRAGRARLRSTVGVWDPEQELFRVDRPGRLILPFEAPPGTRGMHLDIRALGPIDPNASRVDVTIRVVETGENWSPRLLAWQPVTDGQGFRFSGEIPAARCAGVRCVMSLEIHQQPAGSPVEIQPPRPVPGRQAASPQPDRAAPSHPAAELPDIVLVTLDAARFDHFSHAGYHRPTTPNIDRLAAESLVFTNAFALAPYTMCSFPTMLSGLSFLEHGVTERGRSLAPATTTLAEVLRDAGYRTVAFSTNPNNSRATGTDQGYQEFHELWTDETLHDIVDPEVLTDKAIEIISTHDDSMPLHLQLHYMPPHAPYAPAAEFDRFTDPGYEGPCDGSHRTINRLDAGRLSPGEGCLDQVIALYDGGLLAADASVGRLLDALRNRPRWKTTVVLITSDHGEAFLEHGRTSHNSTVYDEMLHVPFILRVPEGFDRSGVDTDRLATLADILPTLLSVTPMQPPQGIEGVDLLNRPDPTRSSDRYFVTRTTGAAPTFGLRTRNWKLILPGSGHGALFNLTKDPLERQNRRFVNRPVYLTLGQLLTTRLASPPSAIQPVEKREISETDREMLEALGYVE